MPFSTCRTSWLIPPSNDADGVGAASSPLVVAAGNATPQCAASRSGDVSSQTTRTIEAEETQVHQRSARPRSPQQQVEHVQRHESARKVAGFARRLTGGSLSSYGYSERKQKYIGTMLSFKPLTVAMLNPPPSFPYNYCYRLDALHRISTESGKRLSSPYSLPASCSVRVRARLRTSAAPARRPCPCSCLRTP